MRSERSFFAFAREIFVHACKLDSTRLYIQIEQAIYKESSDEFTVKAVRTPPEVKSLLEVGFEYVCEKDGLLFLRRRE